MIGQKINMLTVIDNYAPDKNYNKRFLCVCECGKQKIVFRDILKRGRPYSCGCDNKFHKSSHLTHGHMSGNKPTGTYRSWMAMRGRCNRPSNVSYLNYGAKGITVCERWESFENFLSDMGEKPEGMSLDRIDCEGNYEPENCKWSTRKHQDQNKRNSKLLEYGGQTTTLPEWSRITGISISTLRYRLAMGWTLTQAIETPIDPKSSRRNKTVKL